MITIGIRLVAVGFISLYRKWRSWEVGVLMRPHLPLLASSFVLWEQDTVDFAGMRLYHIARSRGLYCPNRPKRDYREEQTSFVLQYKG
jgi:hypothetical protein